MQEPKGAWALKRSRTESINSPSGFTSRWMQCYLWFLFAASAAIFNC
jgi:hypothetical protein